MTAYLYDGTWAGFLTCVYLHYYEEKAGQICPEGQYQLNLLLEGRSVETDEKKAAKVGNAFVEKVSLLSFLRAYKAFLNRDPEKEQAILAYMALGFRIGRGLDDFRNRGEVYRVQKLAAEVSKETERLSGLLRFSVLQSGEREILFGKIRPKHDVLELLGDHFADRFPNDPFVIFDTGREKALFGWDRDWKIEPFAESQIPGFSRSEQEYRRLWRRYFQVIAIKERKNPRCQKNFMPVRYWENLTEMSGAEWQKEKDKKRNPWYNDR